jgi:hypothetical protein
MLPLQPSRADELEQIAAEFFAANPDLDPDTYNTDPEDYCPYWQLPDDF